MILMSYDGSDDANAAIDRAAELMPGAETTVLTVWEPFADVMMRTGAFGFGGLGMIGAYPDATGADEASEKGAQVRADEGAERARAAGLNARPRTAARNGAIAESILDAADDVDADVVVMGTRGLGGVKSFLLGSVSHAVVQHADRAVLVVPSPSLSERRRDAVVGDEVGA